MALGSSVAVGQWVFIMSGTFVYLSWDIMEPISYCMMLGNFVGGFFFYTIAKKDLELISVQEIMARRMATSIYKSKGMDEKRLDKLTQEITVLREVMNKSMQ